MCKTAGTSQLRGMEPITLHAFAYYTHTLPACRCMRRVCASEYQLSRLCRKNASDCGIDFDRTSSNGNANLTFEHKIEIDLFMFITCT